jgi:hypothetical protein
VAYVELSSCLTILMKKAKAVQPIIDVCINLRLFMRFLAWYWLEVSPQDSTGEHLRSYFRYAGKIYVLVFHCIHAFQ